MQIHRFVAALIVALLLGQSVAWAAPPPAAEDPRFFSETSFRIDDDAFWDYFSHRGGVRTFGYPVSRQFTLDGFPVQMFQRGILQKAPDGSVRPLNMLDPDLMPYTQINFSQFPAPDPALKAATPQVGEPDYDRRILEFIQAQAPDTWNGLPVNFYRTFSTTVTCADAFPQGDCREDLLPLLNLELWGAPISAPAYDPANHAFVYQRFQRGIMHFDAGCQCTQGILLADYFKSILTGQNLPPDLAQQAAGSRYFQQYAPGEPQWLRRPADLRNTDLTDAFTAQSPSQEVAGARTSPQQQEGDEPEGPYRAASPEYGMVVHVFGQSTAERDFALVRNAGFSWVKIQFPWRAMEPQRQVYDWAEADRIVELANEYDLKIIARITDAPSWTRVDGGNNGAVDSPPDNFQDYADFIASFVRHFRRDDKRVHAIEVWNEPNIAREWGNQPPNPAQYVQMLQLTYTAAKAASPNITVLTGALTPTGTSDATSMPDEAFLEGMYAAGAQGYFDAIAAHAAGYKAAPETSPDDVAADPTLGGHRFFAFRHVEDLRRIMVAHGDEAKQIWVTEFGWTSDPIHPDYAWFANDEATKGEYLVRAYKWARENWSPWIGVMTAWTVAAPYWTPDNEQYWWAITNPDGTTRPAYDRLAQARATGELP